MATVKGAADRPDLKAEVVAILLAGWGAQPPAGVDPGPPGFGQGMFEAFEAPAALWCQHERFLRATAKAWGWAPSFTLPDGTPAFWAEAEAAEGA
jgi:hypothetical protein